MLMSGNWLNKYFSAVVRYLGVMMPMRGVIDLVGSGVVASDETLEDGTKVTRLTISGGGATPGGSNGDLQRNATGALAPVRTAANAVPAEGDIARYDGSKWIAADDSAELPDTLIVGDLLFWNGSALARIPAGTEGQVLTMVSGVPAWGAGGPAPFSLASIAWSGLLLPDYGGSPWAGTASAGASGGRNFTSGNPPTAGSAVNGNVPASFNGSAHTLQGANVIGDFFTAGAYSLAMLAKFSGAAAPAGNIYDNKQLIASTPYGQFGIAVSTSGVSVWHCDAGGTRYATPWFALSGSAYAMIEVTYNGTTLSLDVNRSGSPQTVSAPNINLAIPPTDIFLRMGANYAGTYTAEDVLVCGLAGFVLNGTELDNIKDAFEDILGAPL